MTMIKKFHAARRLSGAVLITILIGLPFLRVHGESAFRFDIPSLRLLFFGTGVWMADFFILLVAVIFLTFLTLFTTTVLGRVWCGWLCPQTVLVDATQFIETSRTRGPATMTIASLAALALCAVIGVSLIGYFVSPYDLPGLLRAGGTPARIAAGSCIALTVLLFLDLFALRRRFCATACPYAKLQGVLFDDRTLTIAFDTGRSDECMQCSACEKACPVGIDIRKGQQSACIHCAECVDACTARMALRNRETLVNYSFGLPGVRSAGVRINPVITGSVAALSFLFLLYLSTARMPFDVNVHLNYADGPAVQHEHSVTNSYVLSLRNMARSDLDLDMSATSPAGVVHVEPDTIRLQSGPDITKVPIVITLNDGPGPRQSPVKITLTVRSKQDNKTLAKHIYFMMPKKSDSGN
jgi:cytochrome c oxidase accessory protein FixG